MYEIEIRNRQTGEAEVWRVDNAHAMQAIRLHCEISLGQPTPVQYKSITETLPEGPAYTKQYD